MSRFFAALLPRSLAGEPHLVLSLWRWLLLGLLLRLLLMPFTAHADLIYIGAFPHLLAYHGVWDVYRYLGDHFGPVLAQQNNWSYYPPLTYYTLGLFQLLFRPFTPTFDTWMDAYLALMAAGGTSLRESLTLVGTEQVFRNLLFMKLPYLIFDLGLALLLLHLVAAPSKAALAFKFWMINPIILHSAFMFGQYEVIPTFFILLALFLAGRGSPRGSLLALGVAAAYKTVPLVLLAPAALILGRTPKERALLFCLGLAPVLLFFIPLYLTSAGLVLGSVWSPFWDGIYGFTGRPGRMALWGAALGGYLVLLVILWFRPPSLAPERTLRIAFGVSLLLPLFFGPTPLHFLVWVAPILVLEMVERRIFGWVLLGLTTFVVLWSSLYDTHWGGLFAPLNPALFLTFPGPDSLLELVLPAQYVRNAAAWLFRALCALTLGLLLWSLIQQSLAPRLKDALREV